MTFTRRTDWVDLPEGVPPSQHDTPITAADLLRYEQGIYDAHNRNPYVPQLGQWNTALARRSVRNPRMVVIGDSASNEAFAWQHQLAGRRYFDPQLAAQVEGNITDAEFANGLFNGDTTRFAGLLGLTDIDILFGPDSPAGDYRYDEGPWSTWPAGAVWSDTYPDAAPLNAYRIDDMNGANALTMRAHNGAGYTWFNGIMGTVAARPLDVMTLAVPGVSAKWWATQLTGTANDPEVWQYSLPRALVDGFDPDLIVIALGANDLDNTDGDELATFTANLGSVIDAWRTLQPGADIAVQTYWQPTWAPLRDQTLAVAKAKNTALLDFWPLIPPYSQHPSLYVDDYHLNTFGHALLADIATRSLGIPPA